MFATPQYVKYYKSAKKRFLHGALDQFFKNEFQKLFGPMMRDRIVQEIVKIVEAILPHKDYLRPGQIVWNAVSVDTRPDHPNCRFVPVILTLINNNDIEELASGSPMKTIAKKAIARINLEAQKQGAYLSMRDISLFSWRHHATISNLRKEWEKENKTILPHVGSKQDFGSCISHKAIIIRKIILDKKDPKMVARETTHSMKAVDRYLKAFHKVRTCYQQNKEPMFIQLATGLSKNLISQYVRIIEEIEENT